MANGTYVGLDVVPGCRRRLTKAVEVNVYTKGLLIVWNDKQMRHNPESASATTSLAINDILPYDTTDIKVRTLVKLIIIIRTIKLLSFFDVFLPACAAV